MCDLTRIFVTTAIAIMLAAPKIATAQTADRPVQSPNLDPNTMSYVLPADLHWKTIEREGLQIAVVKGDPSKPGPYVFFAKWAPNHMSRPHFHPNDRFITVISGTWWVGSGEVYQPEKTVGMPPGSFVTHFAKQIHYDGAKEDGCIVEVSGEGPATTILAERK